MNLLVAAVGRLRAGPERDLFEHYRRRLSWELTVKEVEERRPMPTAARVVREGELLRACVPVGGVVVVLDECGRTLDSPAFAKVFRSWRDGGRRQVAFLIGGADGHGDGVRRVADLVLSLGAMTWPHLLVRGLLVEQLYRAECILANHPYHRGGERITD